MQQINESDVKNLVSDLAARALSADTGLKTDLITANKNTLVAGINEIKRLLNGVTGIAPSDILNLAADFNFANKGSLTQNGTSISSIVDAAFGINSAQATTANQPGYSATGGPGGTPCATFNGSQTMTGNLLTTSTEFTYIVLRKVDPSVGSGANMGVVHNGNASTGYGIVECQTSGGSIDMSGGFYPGVSGEPSTDYFTFKGQWEILVVVHTAGRTTMFNSLGIPYKGLSQAASPAVPTTGHFIGTLSFGGVIPFKGSISRILLYSRALARAEIKAICTYIQGLLGIGYPYVINFDGDSKMAVLGGTPNTPQQTIMSLRTNGIYSTLINTAVAGRTSADVLVNVNGDLVANFRPEIANVFVLMIGHNDLNASITPTTTYSNIQAICAVARAAGNKLVVCTDIYNSTAAGGTNNTNKDTFNASIRSGFTGFADGLADLNAIAQLTAANMVAGGSYSTDGIHPNSTAAGLMASVIETALATII